MVVDRVWFCPLYSSMAVFAIIIIILVIKTTTIIIKKPEH